MVRFKVKPKRETVPPPCLPALTSLLACFATSGDFRASSECAVAARSLHTCMAGSKGSVKSSKSSINHLLSQASKNR